MVSGKHIQQQPLGSKHCFVFWMDEEKVSVIDNNAVDKKKKIHLQFITFVAARSSVTSYSSESVELGG